MASSAAAWLMVNNSGSRVAGRSVRAAASSDVGLVVATGAFAAPFRPATPSPSNRLTTMM
jgi:hypothetical protein